MAASSQAEEILKRLLVKNKLITANQIKRIIRKHAGKTEKKLYEVIEEGRFVKPELIRKVVMSIEKKGLVFPLLNEDVEGTIEKEKL